LQWRFKAHLRKKYVSEEETPFVKHAFLQQQDWDMFVQQNQFSCILAIEPGDETKESIA
jgi:hypothetical protein